MLSCPSCGAEVPEGFAFCGRCGAPVAAGPRVEERRVVTVLFCDLAGFTARKAHILACRGAVGEAVALKDRFLPRGRDIGDPQVTSNILPIAAFIEQSGGSLDAALALVEELERATRDGPACYRADPLPMVARICRAADQPELAERFLAGADAAAARYRHCLTTAHAVLAETRGDLEVALGRYTAAATGWEEFGVVVEQGQALLGAGRRAARLEGGPGASGRQALGRARAIFDHLGATTLVAETDRQLAESTI